MIKEMLEEKIAEKDIPDFKTGDTIRVVLRIYDAPDKKKSKSKKERTQAFEGIVIARKGYKGQAVLIYRSAFGCSMERLILLYSPAVVSVKVVRYAKVGRAKRYDIRELAKKPRIKESVKRRLKYTMKK